MLKFFHMKSFLRIFVILNLSVFAGCSWLGTKKTVLAEKPSAYVQVVKVADANRIKQGGTIFVNPFNPGPGVVATAELDQSALMTVKGIIDTLKESASKFTVLESDRAAEADLIIQGHITKKKKTSRLKRLLFIKNKISMEIKGKLIDQKTGKTVLVFEDFRQRPNKKEAFKELGYSLGEDIARVILAETMPAEKEQP